VLALFGITSPGCMTIEHAIDPRTPFQVYGGVTTSWDYILREDSSFFGSCCRLIDLPATMVGDTLLLPVSIPLASTADDDE